MKLLAIDPGGKGSGESGVVYGEFSDTEPFKLIDSWAVRGSFEGFRQWYETVGKFLQPDVVVCEHFVNRNVPGADLTPCFIEGMIRYIWPGTILSVASGKNSLVPDKILKRMDLWFIGDHHHDRREAARHALIYLRNSNHVPTLEKMYR